MTSNAARSNFLKQMHEAQRQPQRVGESEIARMARKAGLPLQESLREMRRSTPFRQADDTDAYDALVAFVTRLCREAKSPRILEYARLLSLLTAACAESGVPASCIVPDRHIAEAIEISHQEVREQAIIVPDEELAGLISLGRGST
jgi:hypothetical protein